MSFALSLPSNGETTPLCGGYAFPKLPVKALWPMTSTLQAPRGSQWNQENGYIIDFHSLVPTVPRVIGRHDCSAGHDSLLIVLERAYELPHHGYLCKSPTYPWGIHPIDLRRRGTTRHMLAGNLDVAAGVPDISICPWPN